MELRIGNWSKQLKTCALLAVPWWCVTARAQVVADDSLLLARNAAVRAARAEVEARQADVQSARLWENPTLEMEQNVYNRLNGRWFDLGRQSEQVVSLGQPLPTAGRTHRLAAARAEVEHAEAALALEERRQLLALHRLAIGLWYNAEARNLLEVSHTLALRLSEGVERLEALGEVSAVEAIRVKALCSSLAREVAALDAEAEEDRRAVAVLVAEPDWEQVEVQAARLCADSATLERRLAAANPSSRPDVRMAAAEADRDRQRLQAVTTEGRMPQVTLTASYDRAGNFIENYFAVGASLQLPLWNRNQGARRAAQHEAEASRLRLDACRLEATSGVQAALARWRRAEACLRDMPQVPPAMMASVADAYERRDIGLVEFLDHFEGLREAAILALQLRRDALLAREELYFEL